MDPRRNFGGGPGWLRPLRPWLRGRSQHSYRWQSDGVSARRDSYNFHRALWSCVEKSLPITLGQDSVVENHNNPGIRFAANQASNPLPEFQNGFRKRKLEKGIAAAGFNVLDTGL